MLRISSPNTFYNSDCHPDLMSHARLLYDRVELYITESRNNYALQYPCSVMNSLSRSSK